MWAVALRAGGALVTGIGLAHLAMPVWGYDPAVVEALAPATRAHFLDLATYAIATFLLAFGGLSFALSRRPSPEAGVFCAVMSVVWSVRLGLELRFPVEVSLFSVPAPHLPLLAVIGLVAALYVAATALLLRDRRASLAR